MSDQKQRMKVLGAGIFSLMLALGVARFAYTPLLPLMQSQAGLGLAEGGWLAAINYLGYLSGALLAASISDLVLKDRLYRIGMVVAVLTTLMMGFTTDFTVWAVSRYLAGLSSAAAMLLGTGLILNWLIRHGHRHELGIHFAGIGLGIAGCSVAVALMSLWLDWRAQWYVFTALACVLLVPALAWLPAPDTSPVTKSGAPMHDNPPSPLFMRVFMASYFCAGVGFVVSATFIVAILVQTPAFAGRGSWVWVLVGLTAIPSTFAWDRLSNRLGLIRALMLAYALQATSFVLPLLDGGLWAGAASAVLFGLTFAGIVSLTLTVVGRHYPHNPAKAMATLTLSYGVAQIIAPAIAGTLARDSGSYQGALVLAAIMMVIGIVLLWCMPNDARSTPG